MSSLIKFSLKDKSGNNHQYELTLHPPSESGIRIALQIAGLGIEPLAEMVGGILSELDLDGVQSMLDLDVEAILTKVDFSKIGEKLRPALLSGDSPGLLMDILSLTYRDGKSLSDPEVFNPAYRGNYMELWKAVGKVIQINDFLPLPDISLVSEKMPGLKK
jgi:hypothetical protein